MYFCKRGYNFRRKHVSEIKKLVKSNVDLLIHVIIICSCMPSIFTYFINGHCISFNELFLILHWDHKCQIHILIYCNTWCTSISLIFFNIFIDKKYFSHDYSTQSPVSWDWCVFFFALKRHLFLKVSYFSSQQRLHDK